MKNNAFSIWIKVLTLTCVFFVVINYFWYFIKADNTKTIKELSVENKQKFTTKDINVLSPVWVALTTNIWTRYKERKEIPVSIYKDVLDIWYILSNQNVAKDKIITVNMIAVNEYLNILKTDVRWLLAWSNDRAFALNSFISQLEYRYKIWIENSKTLMMQKTELTKSFNETEAELESIKTKMWKDFWNFDSNQTIKNMDDYLKLREENLNARTYIIFIDKFLLYYSTLNNYNKKILDTLINNKEILVKNTQVVIPDTGWTLLKDLKILYTEEEWKKQ